MRLFEMYIPYTENNTNQFTMKNNLIRFKVPIGEIKITPPQKKKKKKKKKCLFVNIELKT